MDTKKYYILGTIFIFLSGIVYTIEKIMAYFVWKSQLIYSIKGISVHPERPNAFSNIFVVIFFLIAVFFFVSGYRRKDIY